MESFSDEAILDIEIKQNLLAACGSNANSIAKYIVRWLKIAKTYRLTNTDFNDLIANYPIDDFPVEYINSIQPGTVFSLEMNFMESKNDNLLPGGYTQPNSQPNKSIQGSSRRISLVVRLNKNRIKEFISSAGEVALNGFPEHEFQRGGVVFIPIAYIDNLNMWVASYGCAVVSATNLAGESDRQRITRELREGRYTEHCTDSDSARKSPLPYFLIVIMPEVLSVINDSAAAHINETLLADINDEFVTGMHFLHARATRHLWEKSIECSAVYKRNITLAQIVF